MRILLIEGSDILQNKLNIIFNDLGVKEVYSVKSAEEALNDTRDLNIKLIVFDIASEWMNNRSAISFLKEKYMAQIAVLSSIPDQYFKSSSLNAGADFYFDRSTEIDDFIELIKKLVTKGRIYSNIRSMFSAAKSMLSKCI